MVFFSFFFEIFIFWAVRRGGDVGNKRAKNNPKWKITITSVTSYISGTVKHMIMIFGTLLLNDDISRCFIFCIFCILLFFFFLLFSFFGLGGGGAVGDKRTKNGLILQKNSVCCTSYLRIHISYNCHLWYACVKWWYLQVFFFSFFFKILILWVVREGVGFSLLRGGEI